MEHAISAPKHVRAHTRSWSLPVWMWRTSMSACGRQKRQGGAGGTQSPQGVVSGSIRPSLSSPVTDNSGVVQPRVGWAALGPWWSTMAFRNSFHHSTQHSSNSHSALVCTLHSHPSTKRVITELRSLLPDPSKYEKGLQINTKISFLDSKYQNRAWQDEGWWVRVRFSVSLWCLQMIRLSGSKAGRVWLTDTSFTVSAFVKQ